MAMTPIDMRDLLNHIDHFGSSAVVRKMRGKWFIDFRGFGFPVSFKTKNEAMTRVGEWYLAISRHMRESGLDRYGRPISA